MSHPDVIDFCSFFAGGYLAVRAAASGVGRFRPGVPCCCRLYPSSVAALALLACCGAAARVFLRQSLGLDGRAARRRRAAFRGRLPARSLVAGSAVGGRPKFSGRRCRLVFLRRRRGGANRPYPEALSDRPRAHPHERSTTTDAAPNAQPDRGGQPGGVRRPGRARSPHSRPNRQG